jgi:hypothetical protein
VEAVMFADDICLLPIDEGYLAFDQLQKALDGIADWATKTHTTFNIKQSKSSAMMFTRLSNDNYPSEKPLKLGKHTLPYDESYKYLGLVLDKQLNWKLQAATAIKKAAASSAQISRIINRNRSFTVHCVATLVRTITIPRCMYAAQFWKPTTSTLNKIDAAIVKPLARALNLPWSAHRLSILTECNILTASRCVILYGANYVFRALTHPTANPSTLAVANDYNAAIDDSKHSISRKIGNTPINYNTALPPGIFTTIPRFNPDTVNSLQSHYKHGQVRELTNAHYGSSLRLAIPQSFTMTKQPHLMNEQISAAQRRAKFRFDYISPWRESTQVRINKTERNKSVAKCKHCGTPDARAVHLLRCTALAHIRQAHPVMNRCRRALATVLPKWRRISSQSTIHTILAGYHPLLSTIDNTKLMRDSQRFLTALLKEVKSRSNC